MKKLFLSLVVAVFVLSGCGVGQNQDKEQAQQVVENFFSLIDEGKVSDALLLAHSGLDNLHQQVWIVNFDVLDSAKIKSIEQVDNPDAPDKLFYKVILDVDVKDGAATYRWQEGEDNELWLTMEKDGDNWRISTINNVKPF